MSRLPSLQNPRERARSLPALGWAALCLVLAVVGPDRRLTTTGEASGAGLERGADQPVLGVVDPLCFGKVELPRAASTGAPSRHAPDGWSAAAPPRREHALLRRVGTWVSRQERGRLADQPSILTCPSQGPPAPAFGHLTLG